MLKRLSVGHRLIGGLLLVGAVGTVSLIYAVLSEYGIPFSALLDPTMRDAASTELFDHVLIPLVVLILPMGLATTWVIRTAFEPLSKAARHIETAPTERGMQIDEADIPTEAKPFVRSINNLLHRLDASAQQQADFASDVAHELRTPLAILSLELDRREGSDGDPLKAQVSAMRRLVDQLLLLAQIDADATMPMTPEPLDLETLAEDSVSSLAATVIAQGREIAIESEGQMPMIYGHREAIGAGIRNLIENAVRATPMGGTVTIISGPGAIIRVRDQGAGLSEEKLAQLIRRHQRADHASPHGAGLGLSITHRIMSAHNGHIRTSETLRELILDFRPQ